MIVSVVGTRPQFIKAAILSNTLEMDMIDTGQHYDYEMAGQYLEGLKVKHLESNGDVSSMYKRLILALDPYDTVIVYGDCNTTLAGALAAKHLGKRLVHIEAGCRSYDRRMIEEGIRITVDSLSDLNLCSTVSALMNLHDEELQGEFVGDLSWDYIEKKRNIDVIPDAGMPLITIHRAESMEYVDYILEVIGRTPYRYVWPQHPKMKDYELPGNVWPFPPLNYYNMLTAVIAAPFLITDSGGLQKEAYMLKTKCITLRQSTEWPETLTGGWNTLVGTDEDKILKAIEAKPKTHRDGLFGDGHAAERIKEHVEGID